MTYLCPAAAYTAASVVTYNYIDQKELEKIFSSSFSISTFGARMKNSLVRAGSYERVNG